MLYYGINIKYKLRNLENRNNTNLKNRLDFLRKCLEMVVKIYNKDKQKYKWKKYNKIICIDYNI